jgi:hypothetical protein
MCGANDWKRQVVSRVFLGNVLVRSNKMALSEPGPQDADSYRFNVDYFGYDTYLVSDSGLDASEVSSVLLRRYLRGITRNQMYNIPLKRTSTRILAPVKLLNFDAS